MAHTKFSLGVSIDYMRIHVAHTKLSLSDVHVSVSIDYMRIDDWVYNVLNRTVCQLLTWPRRRTPLRSASCYRNMEPSLVDLVHRYIVSGPQPTSQQLLMCTTTVHFKQLVTLGTEARHC